MTIADTVEVKDANGAIREVRTLPATFPVSGPFLTEAQLRAAPVAISGALTDSELRAVPVPVSFSFPATQPVSLASVPSHAVTQGGPWLVSQGDVWSVSLASVPTHGVTQSGVWSVSISGSVAVTGLLTDTQLRAAPLAVTGAFFQATQPVSAAALPLPSGASTEATLAAIKAKTDNLDVLLSTRTKAADSQHVTVDNLSLAVTGTFWQATQPVSGPLTDTQLRAGPVAVSGTFFQATQPVSAAALPLPSGASTETTLAAVKGKTDNLDVLLSTRLKPADTLAKVSVLDTITNPVAVTGTFFQATQPVSGPLTDAQLRASAVPVSGFPAWPYPATVTRVAQQSANLANAQGTATLAAAVGKTTYLTSLQIFATGATAAGAFSVTITGLLGGTMTIPFDVPAGVNLRATPLILEFALPLPASAVNTAIVVTLPALGSGNTRATVNAQGFQQ